MRRDVQRVANASLGFLALFAGGNQTLLRAATFLAAFGEFRKRDRGLVIRLALHDLGSGEKIGRRPTRGFSLLKLGHAARGACRRIRRVPVRGRRLPRGLPPRGRAASAICASAPAARWRQLARSSPMASRRRRRASFSRFSPSWRARASASAPRSVATAICCAAEFLVDRRKIRRVLEFDQRIFFLKADLFHLRRQTAHCFGHDIAAANEIAGRTLGCRQRLAGLAQMPGGKPAGFAR